MAETPKGDQNLETPSGERGNTEEDWKVFEILCTKPPSEMDVEGEHDVLTSLRSDLAGLQYKRDKLQSEVGDLKGQMLAREQRLLELQVEIDHLREQSARQNAIISSLKKKVLELEDRERSLYAAQGRSEIALQTLHRDNKYHEERSKELEKKLRSLELECCNEEQLKENARSQFHDLIRRLSGALGADFCETSCGHSPEGLLLKAAELVQETQRLKAKCCNVTETISCVEQDFRSCRDALERANADKEIMHRQITAQAIDIDRLRQDKEQLEVHNRVIEREMHDCREKLGITTKNLSTVTGSATQSEGYIIQLKDDLKHREDKYQRLHLEFKNTLESLAILLSLPTRFVESQEGTIKERIREILNENKDKSAQIESLRDKLTMESHTLTRTSHANEQITGRLRVLEDERNILESKVHKLEAELGSMDMSRDALRREKAHFLAFLERLCRTLSMEEIAQEVGLELHTDSILLRAEQLARLENEKIVDKFATPDVSAMLQSPVSTADSLPSQRRLQHRRNVGCYKLHQTAVVYQLQRRIRTLKEQLQRRDLHLDLLRRKLTIQEDSAKMKTILQTERDEAVLRSKKLSKQVDKLSTQITEARIQIRDLNNQLSEAADYKISALERGRKVDELQKRLIEADMMRTRYSRKVNILKDHVRNTGETIEQEKSIVEHQLAMIKEELARVKEMLADANKREAQLQSLRTSFAKLLGVISPSTTSDFELISRLQKLIDAHHDFTLVSRRYEDPVLLRAVSRSPVPPLRASSRSPPPLSRCRTRSPDRSLRYDDSGYADHPDFHDMDDDLFGKSRAAVSRTLHRADDC